MTPQDHRPDTASDAVGPAAPGRALTARSVLLSVLLGTDPPRLPVALLVSTTELFGISEGTTRTALSRMVTKGELRVQAGRYELAAERLLRRQARQTASLTGRTRVWTPSDGWLQAVVVSSGRRPADERAALREALTEARLAELRDGVWLRPDNLEIDRARLGTSPLLWGRFDPDASTAEGPSALAARLWDLDGWGATARRLQARLAEVAAPLSDGKRDALADGFVVAAGVLRHLQADPLLPPSLLPADWPGATLRSDYERFDAAYRAVLREWFDAHRVPVATPD